MNRKLRQTIEAAFCKLARVLYQHSNKTLLLVFILIVSLTAFIPMSIIDTSAVALLRENDPARIRYDQFRQQFDVNDMVIIAITAPEIFNIDFLSRLRAFHKALETEVPYIKEVNSLFNARHTYGQGDDLIVEELLAAWPQNQTDLDILQKNILSNRFYPNSLISEDGKVVTVLLETEAILNDASTEVDILAGFDDDEIEIKNAPRYFGEKENQQVVEAVNQLVKKYDRPDFSLAVAGDPVVLDVYNRAMERDIIMVVLLSLATIAVFLALLFQRVSGVLLPEIIIISALSSTLGLLSLFKVSIKLTTIVLPGFLLAVSVGYAVHILSIFYVHFQKGNSKEDSIAHAIGHSGLAVVLTAFTTAASLFSFAFSELTSIADLGFFGATGVLLAMVYTILLLPALLAVLPVKRKQLNKNIKKSQAMDKILLSIANFSIRQPKKVVIGSLILFGLSIFFTFQVSYSHNVLNWISKEEKIQEHVQFIDDHLKGASILEVIVDTHKEDGVKNPALLKKIQRITENLSGYNESGIFVGKVFSLNDIIKEINQSLHDNDENFYALPDDRRSISQELLLFENSGSDDLERVVDQNYQKTRISIKIPWTDAVHLEKFIDHVQTVFDTEFNGVATVHITGIPAILARSIPASLHSMVQSYIIAFIVITLLMIVHVGNTKIGLLSMISNLLPIFMTIGLMAALRIKLDMSTIMIGSIAIGIVVDDTLHFMYNFRKFYEDTQDVTFAIRETMLGTGRALLLTSLILSSGFFILMTASLSLLVVFGALTGITIIFALLADFIVNPAIMFLVTKKDSTTANQINMQLSDNIRIDN